MMPLQAVLGGQHHLFPRGATEQPLTASENAGLTEHRLI